MKGALTKAGVLFDEAKLDNMVNNPALFLNYDFVTKIPNTEGRDWLLQGYLFPDTYEFDMNTNEESIIQTFLNNTKAHLSTTLYDRAKVMGYTMDQVIILASLVEKESGRIEQMDMVAEVFLNRLKAKNHETGNRLESDATLNYIKVEKGGKASLTVTAEDKAVTSPYNTYLNKGLPIGPICSPGMNAISAVLWPAKGNLYYFVSLNDGTGMSVFAPTQREHINNVNAAAAAAAKRSATSK